jgi:hypothetical protein
LDFWENWWEKLLPETAGEVEKTLPYISLERCKERRDM